MVKEKGFIDVVPLCVLGRLDWLRFGNLLGGEIPIRYGHAVIGKALGSDIDPVGCNRCGGGASIGIACGGGGGTVAVVGVIDGRSRPVGRWRWMV